MKRFELRNPSDWYPAPIGDVIHFRSPTERTVNLTFNTTDRIRVYVSDDPDMTDRTLLAASDGFFSASFLIAHDCYLSCEGPDAVEVWVRGLTPDHVVPKTHVEVYTSLAPTGRRDPDLYRMQLLMAQNEERRQREFKAQIDRLKVAAAPPDRLIEEPTDDENLPPPGDLSPE